MNTDLAQRVDYMLRQMPAKAHSRMADELAIPRKHVKNFIAGRYAFSERDMERIVQWILEESGTLSYHLEY